MHRHKRTIYPRLGPIWYGTGNDRIPAMLTTSSQMITLKHTKRAWIRKEEIVHMKLDYSTPFVLLIFSWSIVFKVIFEELNIRYSRHEAWGVIRQNNPLGGPVRFAERPERWHTSGPSGGMSKWRGPTPQVPFARDWPAHERAPLGPLTNKKRPPNRPQTTPLKNGPPPGDPGLLVGYIM